MNIFFLLYFIVFPHHFVTPYEGLGAGWKQVGQLAAPLSSLVELPVFLPSSTARLTPASTVAMTPYRLSIPSMSFAHGQHGSTTLSSSRHSKVVATPDPIQQLLALIGPPPRYPLLDAPPARLLLDPPPPRLLLDAPPARLLIDAPPSKGWVESATNRASSFVQDKLGVLSGAITSTSNWATCVSTTMASSGLASYAAGVVSALVGQRVISSVKGGQVCCPSLITMKCRRLSGVQTSRSICSVATQLVSEIFMSRVHWTLSCFEDPFGLVPSHPAWKRAGLRREVLPLHIEAPVEAVQESDLEVPESLCVYDKKRGMPFMSLSRCPTERRSGDLLLDPDGRTP